MVVAIYRQWLLQINNTLYALLARMTKLIGDNNTSYILMFINAGFYVAAFNTIKLHPDVKQGTMNVERGLIGVGICYAMLTNQSAQDKPEKDNDLISINSSQYFRLVAIRIILVSVCQIIYGLMVVKVPVSVIMIITNSAPIMVLVLNALLYQFPTTKRDILGAIIGFLGLALVLNPNLLSIGAGDLEASPVATTKYAYAEGIERYICLAILFAVTLLWSYTIIMVKKMQGHVNTMQLTFYQSLGFILIAGCHQVTYGESQFADDPNFYSQMAWGFSIGLLFFICQIFFFGALNVTKNHGLASMVNYSQVLFSFLVEIIFYDEVPTLVQGIGVVGIIFGLGLVLLK